MRINNDTGAHMKTRKPSNFRFAENIDNHIDRIADKLGLTRTGVVSSAVAAMYEREFPPPKFSPGYNSKKDAADIKAAQIAERRRQAKAAITDKVYVQGVEYAPLTLLGSMVGESDKALIRMLRSVWVNSEGNPAWMRDWDTTDLTCDGDKMYDWVISQYKLHPTMFDIQQP